MFVKEREGEKANFVCSFMQTELDLKQTASAKESKDRHVRRIPRIQAENIIRVAMTTLTFKSRLCADSGNTALAFRNLRVLERG